MILRVALITVYNFFLAYVYNNDVQKILGNGPQKSYRRPRFPAMGLSWHRDVWLKSLFEIQTLNMAPNLNDLLRFALS